MGGPQVNTVVGPPVHEFNLKIALLTRCDQGCGACCEHALRMLDYASWRGTATDANGPGHRRLGAQTLWRLN
jgi:hypothetical protein